jgi:hypothetical protein
MLRPLTRCIDFCALPSARVCGIELERPIVRPARDAGIDVAVAERCKDQFPIVHSSILGDRAKVVDVSYQ